MSNKNTSNSQKTQKTSSNSSTSQRAGQSSSNTGSTMPQSQQGQNVSAQPTGHYQQQGQGQRQTNVGGQYGQPAASQPVQGSSLGGNTAQTQSSTSAPGQQVQYPQELKWRNILAPGNQQGATGQGSSSSTNASGTGAGPGPGPYGSTMPTDSFRHHRGGGPPNRGTRGPGRSRGRRG